MHLAARDENPAAFDRRCIPPGCVASRSNTTGILPRRALPAGRITALGATRDFHHGLLGIFARNGGKRVSWFRADTAIGCLAVALVVWVGGTVRGQDADREHEAAARAALEEYFRAWNAGDNDAVAAISNFPRLSLGQNGQVVVRETPDEIATDFDVLRQSGWDHSTLDLAESVHVTPDKVHFRIVFSRYSADGTPYTTAPGLYVITNQNGHWGLQLQSILPATFTR